MLADPVKGHFVAWFDDVVRGHPMGLPLSER